MSNIMNIIKSIIFSTTILFMCQVGAADFSSKIYSPNINIDGEIKQGDFKRFNSVLLEHMEDMKKFRGKDFYNGDYSVSLNSPGGSVEEALLFAEMFRKHYFNVSVQPDKRCLSSCTIMFAGGVERKLWPNASLGFHRLRLVRKEFDIDKTKIMTDLENKKVTAFLQDIGFPNLLIEKMNSTPPSDIYIVNEVWLKENELSNAIKFQPAFIDVIEKLCGSEPGSFDDLANIAPFVHWTKCKFEVVDRNRKNIFEDLRKNAK